MSHSINETKEKQIISRELSLYLHVPFCVRKCDYCDFLSGPANEETIRSYFQALQKEIRSYEGRIKEYQVSTIFIGGGTPSSVDALYISDLLTTIKDVFPIGEGIPEITIEINPGTIDREKLLIYQRAGINRLSFGLQSTEEKYLKLLGRIHSYDQFVKNYALARELGFHNINIDLMSALPGQSLQDWEHTLKKVISLKPEHISAYSLIIEEGTPFYDRYYEGKEFAYLLPEEDTDRRMYQRTKEILAEHGYLRYEISNYAKPDYECKHNLTYWIGKDYLGLGLGASSLIKNLRFRNTDSRSEYIQLCSSNGAQEECSIDTRCDILGTEEGILREVYNIRRETIQLTKAQQMEEFMFLGLRVLTGVSKNKFGRRFGISIEEVYQPVLDKLVKQQLIENYGDTIRLTEYGIDVSNMVLAEFLLDEDL